jgi:hypothetical protein
MLRFYKQGWLKTLIKSLLLDVSIGVFVFILVLSYVINTFLSLPS